jgi:hypothetical protein
LEDSEDSCKILDGSLAAGIKAWALFDWAGFIAAEVAADEVIGGMC